MRAKDAPARGNEYSFDSPLHANGNVVLKDVLYEKEDLLNYLHQSIAQYDKIVETYRDNPSEI